MTHCLVVTVLVNYCHEIYELVVIVLFLYLLNVWYYCVVYVFLCIWQWDFTFLRVCLFNSDLMIIYLFYKLVDYVLVYALLGFSCHFLHSYYASSKIEVILYFL